MRAYAFIQFRKNVAPLSRRPDTWSLDHPLAVGFSVLDAHAATVGESHPLTGVFAERLAWWVERSAPFLTANTAASSNTFFSGPLHSFRLSVTLTEAPRHAERSQWRIHVVTEPPFMRLANFQQDAARMILRQLTQLVIAWEETEDVDVVNAE